MIPQADIRLWLDDPNLAAGLPAGDELQAVGFADQNWEYQPGYADSTWEDALQALEVEAELIAAADARSTTASEFDGVLDGDLEDWQIMALQGIDAGVAAAVFALNAAGCATTTSCRGHPGRYAGAGRDFPRVRFMADRPRATAVRDAAEAAGCAFGVEPPMFEVFARTVTDMHAFAANMLAARAVFDSMPG